MDIERRNIPQTEAGRTAWLAWRKANVNASEIGALFGDHPYITIFELFCEKSGRAERKTPDDSVLWRGQIFEPAVAEAVRLRHPDWKISKADEYLSDTALRIGATPDYYIECPKRGRGVLQIKTVGTLPKQMANWDVADAKDWENDAHPPLWVQQQTLTEQRLAGVAWGAVAALLLDPNNPRLAIREFERHDHAEKRIIEAIKKFWKSVKDDTPPSPDYARDSGTINALYPQDNGRTVDLSHDNRLPELLARREALMQQSEPLKEIRRELEAINTEIAAKIGSATYATLPGWKLSRKLQKRKATPATEFRVLRVKSTPWATDFVEMAKKTVMSRST